MLAEKQVRQLFFELIEHESAIVRVRSQEVLIRTWEHGEKISLITPIYCGEDFLPLSVRRCAISHPSVLGATIKAALRVDDNRFRVDLTYQGGTTRLNHHRFNELLADFVDLAEEWRTILDEHDRNDLIHVRIQ